MTFHILIFFVLSDSFEQSPQKESAVSKQAARSSTAGCASRCTSRCDSRCTSILWDIFVVFRTYSDEHLFEFHETLNIIIYQEVVLHFQ